jgi:hypothetical protein
LSRVEDPRELFELDRDTGRGPACGLRVIGHDHHYRLTGKVDLPFRQERLVLDDAADLIFTGYVRGGQYTGYPFDPRRRCGVEARYPSVWDWRHENRRVQEIGRVWEIVDEERFAARVRPDLVNAHAVASWKRPVSILKRT